MMLCGGLLMAAGFAVCSLTTMAWPVTAAMASSGLGFYLMHNTLQTRATQIRREPQTLSSFAAARRGVVSSTILVLIGLQGRMNFRAYADTSEGYCKC
jgi:hypothetical protein